MTSTPRRSSGSRDSPPPPDAAFIAAGGAEYMTGKNRYNITALDGVARSAAATEVNMDGLAAGTTADVESVYEMQATFSAYDQTVSDAHNSVKFFDIFMNALLRINTTGQEATKLLTAAVRSTADAFKAGTEATDGNIESPISASEAIDTTTKAGSDRYDRLRDVANTYDVATTSAYGTAVQNGDMAGALDKAKAAADGARQKFLDQAAAMGISGDKARALADGLGIVEG